MSPAKGWALIVLSLAVMIAITVGIAVLFSYSKMDDPSWMLL